MNYLRATFSFFILAAIVIPAASPIRAQATPDEHSGHHPPEQTSPMPAPNANANTNTNANVNTNNSGGMTNGAVNGTGGGMMGGMAEMMKQATNPRKELYPSLMELPDLPPEKRAEIQKLADERVNKGNAVLSSGLKKLTDANRDQDFARMQAGNEEIRQGQTLLASGLAVQLALVQGKAPRDIALQWFQQDMNLLPQPAHPKVPGTFLGITPIHLFTMVLLIGFALAMVAMYFFKMRRAAALFGRLEPAAGSPPPGSSPALAGTPVPSGPGTSPPTTPPSASPSTAVSSPPLTAKWTGQLRVVSIVSETPSVKTFRLLSSTGSNLLPFTFLPGQFLNLAFAIGGARMYRSYSISSSPTKRKYVELTVRREPRGAVSRHIADLIKVGDEIEAGGPVGKFTFDGTEADSVVLISGGVGITPMMSIARYLTDRSWDGDIFFVSGYGRPADRIFAKDIAKLQRRNPKLHVVVTVDNAAGTDWKGSVGPISKGLLTESIPDIGSRRIHVCGPSPMIDAVKAILAELGVPSDQVKTELFGPPEPTPGAPGTTANKSAPATGPLVMFSKNNKSANIHVGETVLELSEELDIGIAFSCRVGTCGVCKVKMASGNVAMAVEDALDAADKINGIILACQAKPTGDIVVEA